MKKRVDGESQRINDARVHLAAAPGCAAFPLLARASVPAAAGVPCLSRSRSTGKSGERSVVPDLASQGVWG